MINYTERIALLMRDVVARTARLSFIDLKEVIVFASILPVLLWRSLRDPHSEEH